MYLYIYIYMYMHPFRIHFGKQVPPQRKTMPKGMIVSRCEQTEMLTGMPSFLGPKSRHYLGKAKRADLCGVEPLLDVTNHLWIYQHPNSRWFCFFHLTSSAKGPSWALTKISSNLSPAPQKCRCFQPGNLFVLKRPDKIAKAKARRHVNDVNDVNVKETNLKPRIKRPGLNWFLSSSEVALIRFRW